MSHRLHGLTQIIKAADAVFFVLNPCNLWPKTPLAALSRLRKHYPENVVIFVLRFSLGEGKTKICEL